MQKGTHLVLVPPAMLQTYRGAQSPIPDQCPRREVRNILVLLRHRQWGSWVSSFFVPKNLFCVYTLMVKHSAKLYQSEHCLLPAPQNTRLLRDNRDRQCEDHSSFFSSLTCRNKWLRWIFALNDAGCEFNSFSGVCIYFFSERGIYLQSKLYFFRDLLCPRKQRKKNLR